MILIDWTGLCIDCFLGTTSDSDDDPRYDWNRACNGFGDSDCVATCVGSTKNPAASCFKAKIGLLERIMSDWHGSY